MVLVLKEIAPSAGASNEGAQHKEAKVSEARPERKGGAPSGGAQKHRPEKELAKPRQEGAVRKMFTRRKAI